MNERIVIAGAGIGGLAAALSLQARGFPVLVLEQASELKALGAGIQLSPNATRVLLALGLGEALSRITVRPGGKLIRLWNTGQTWTLFDLGKDSLERYGAPYMMLYRPELLQVMVDALQARAPGALRLGARIVDVSQGSSTVSVVLESGEVVEGTMLVGADGVHSVARAKLIAEDHPRFSGCIAWRGVIPVEMLPASMQGPEGVNWVGPGGHFIHYPISAGALVGFTGVVEKQGWFRESWTESGSVEECLADFFGWHEHIHELIRQVPRPMRWAMMVRDPLTNWSNGRVTLLGDAAHPTLPFLAQGAGMAIEDGCVIARAVAAHPNHLADAALAYQNSRIERTTRIVLESAANATRFHSRELADPARAEGYVKREWQEGATRSRYEWLFSYKAEAVALAAPQGANAIT